MHSLNVPSTPNSADFSFCNLDVSYSDKAQSSTQKSAPKVPSPKRKSAFRAYRKPMRNEQTPQISPNQFGEYRSSMQMDRCLKKIWEFANAHASIRPRPTLPMTPRFNPLISVSTSPAPSALFPASSLQPIANSLQLLSLSSALEIANQSDTNCNRNGLQKKDSPKRTQVSLSSWLPNSIVNEGEHIGPIRQETIRKMQQPKSSQVFKLGLVRDYNSMSINDMFSSKYAANMDAPNASKKRRLNLSD